MLSYFGVFDNRENDRDLWKQVSETTPVILKRSKKFPKLLLRTIYKSILGKVKRSQGPGLKNKRRANKKKDGGV